MNRSFGNLEMKIVDNKVSSVFGAVKKTLNDGATEEHSIAWSGNDFICNCQGFMIHKVCRHTKALATLITAIDTEMDTALEVLNEPRGQTTDASNK